MACGKFLYLKDFSHTVLIQDCIFFCNSPDEHQPAQCDSNNYNGSKLHLLIKLLPELKNYALEFQIKVKQFLISSLTTHQPCIHTIDKA